jgi:CheY-like chemotaxis protein
MDKNPPIVIIDDDNDDLELLSEAFKALHIKNELHSFKSSQEALVYLNATREQPLLILCDVNMSGINGFDLRKMLNADDNLRTKTIPFLFLSTSANKQDVNKAYSLSAQGYFRKPNSFEEVVKMLEQIMGYWDCCLRPNAIAL